MLEAALARIVRAPDAAARRALVAEKRARFPDALARVRGESAVVAVPGHVLGAAGPDRAELVVEALGALGPGPVRFGGPADGYLVSGAAPEDRGWLEALGFTERARHLDLELAIAPAPPAAGVRRAGGEEVAALAAWIAQRFAAAWAAEAARARAVFVAGAPGAWLGFAAHSGNNGALGTFGPLGVAPGARGRGLGAALARAALGDLAASGFAIAHVPWVLPGVAPFYERIGRCVRSERIVLVRG